MVTSKEFFVRDALAECYGYNFPQFQSADTRLTAELHGDICDTVYCRDSLWPQPLELVFGVIPSEKCSVKVSIVLLTQHRFITQTDPSKIVSTSSPALELALNALSQTPPLVR